MVGNLYWGLEMTVTDTSSIEVSLVSFEAFRRGPLRGTAAVAMLIDGVEIVTAGWLVLDQQGALAVQPPTLAHPRTGKRIAAVTVPAAVQSAIAVMLVAALAESVSGPAKAST